MRPSPSHGALLEKLHILILHFVTLFSSNYANGNLDSYQIIVYGNYFQGELLFLLRYKPTCLGTGGIMADNVMVIIMFVMSDGCGYFVSLVR